MIFFNGTMFSIVTGLQLIRSVYLLWQTGQVPLVSVPFKYASRVLSVVSGSNICSLDKAKLWAGYARSGRQAWWTSRAGLFSAKSGASYVTCGAECLVVCVCVQALCTCTWAASHHYLLSKGHHGCPPTITSWPSVEVIRQGNIILDYLQENPF